MDSRADDNFARIQEAVSRQKRAERNAGAQTERTLDADSGGQVITSGQGPFFAVELRVKNSGTGAGDATTKCSYVYDVLIANGPPSQDPIDEDVDPTVSPHLWTRWQVGAYRYATAGLAMWDETVTIVEGGRQVRYRLLWTNEIQEVSACS